MPSDKKIDWDLLLNLTIARASSRGSRRLPALMQAKREGRPERLLRLWSIVSPADIDREFPIKR